MNRIISAIIALLIISTNSFALTTVQNRLQNVLDTYRQQHKITGMSLSITSHLPNRQFRYVLYSGKQAKNQTRKVDRDTQFQVGSTTKSFVAATILQLAAQEKNHFNIKQRLGQWVNDYPQWQDITIEQLLHHTSGIYNYTEEVLTNGDVVNPNNMPWTPAGLIQVATTKPLYFKTGNGWHYSNTNYLLLAEVIKSVSQHTFKEHMQRLIAKAELKHSDYLPQSYPKGILRHMAHGYNSFGVDITEKPLSWADAAGALISNAEDLDKWFYLLIDTQRILSDEQRQKMQTLVCQNNGPIDTCPYPGKPMMHPDDKTSAYGLGIAYEHGAWTHDGSTLGYYAKMVYFPKQKVSMAITSNISPLEMKKGFQDLIIKSLNEIETSYTRGV